MDMKTKVWVQGVLLILACLLVLAFFDIHLDYEKQQQKQVVATVNGIPIKNSELKHWMLLNKAEVYNHYYRKYELPPDKNFWLTQLNGQTPLDKLKYKSLNEIVRIKVKQQLAEKLGIEVTKDYRDLMTERLKVNEIRKKKAESGKVIYGPVTFNPRTYFSRVHDKMVLKSKKILAKNRFAIPIDKMESLYNEYKMNKITITSENKDPDIASFADFKAVKRNSHAEEEYEALVDELVLRADTKINQSIYEEVNLE